MNNYSVYVSGRVSRVYEVNADSKEDAMVEALEYFNEFATSDFTDKDTVSQVFADAEELSIEEESETAEEKIEEKEENSIED